MMTAGRAPKGVPLSTDLARQHRHQFPLTQCPAATTFRAFGFPGTLILRLLRRHEFRFLSHLLFPFMDTGHFGYFSGLYSALLLVPAGWQCEVEARVLLGVGPYAQSDRAATVRLPGPRDSGGRSKAD
jgi:hypothetical protein